MGAEHNQTHTLPHPPSYDALTRTRTSKTYTCVHAYTRMSTPLGPDLVTLWCRGRSSPLQQPSARYSCPGQGLQDGPHGPRPAHGTSRSEVCGSPPRTQALAETPGRVVTSLHVCCRHGARAWLCGPLPSLTSWTWLPVWPASPQPFQPHWCAAKGWCVLMARLHTPCTFTAPCVAFPKCASQEN